MTPHLRHLQPPEARVLVRELLKVLRAVRSEERGCRRACIGKAAVTRHDKVGDVRVGFAGPVLVVCGRGDAGRGVVALEDEVELRLVVGGAWARGERQGRGQMMKKKTDRQTDTHTHTHIKRFF